MKSFYLLFSLSFSVFAIQPNYQAVDCEAQARNAEIRQKLKSESAQTTWDYLVEVAQLPRNAHRSEAVRELFRREAEKQGFEFLRDDYGNFVVSVPGVGESIGIQGHADMIYAARISESAATNPDEIGKILEGQARDDYFSHGIQNFVLAPDGFVESVEQRNSIGDDNGFFLAYALKVLRQAKSRSNGRPVEIIVTLDEEDGLLGAAQFGKIGNDPHGIKLLSKQILNFDGEDFGKVGVGSMGAERFELSSESISIDSFKTSSDDVVLELALTDLIGGHGGGAIHYGINSGVQLLKEAIIKIQSQYPPDRLRFLSFKGGGNGDYTKIAQNFSIRVLAKKADQAAIKGLFEAWAQEKEADEKQRLSKFEELRERLSKLKYRTVVAAQTLEDEVKLIPSQEVTRFLSLISNISVGVIQGNTDYVNGVETTSNLGYIAMAMNSDQSAFELSANLMVRGFVEASMDSSITDQLQSFEPFQRNWNMQIRRHARFPAWEPNFNSALLAQFIAVAQARGHTFTPVTVAGGLEPCFFSQYGIDVIAFGGNIQNPHTPQERFELQTFEEAVLIGDDLLSNH